MCFHATPICLNIQCGIAVCVSVGLQWHFPKVPPVTLKPTTRAALLARSRVTEASPTLARVRQAIADMGNTVATGIVTNGVGQAANAGVCVCVCVVCVGWTHHTMHSILPPLRTVCMCVCRHCSHQERYLCGCHEAHDSVT